MNKIIWGNIAKKHNGLLWVWIEQAADTLLKKVNSSGVCAALALDFVTAFQVGRVNPSNFLNDIKDASAVPPGTNRIPKKYLEIQSALKAILDQNKAAAKQLGEEIKLAEGAEKKELQQKARALLDSLDKQRFGPGMQTVIKFEEDSPIAPIQIIVEVINETSKLGPSYFYVSMSDKKDNSHAIAFGIRPDISTASYPKVYNYFDANLGLFVFKTEDDLNEFFSSAVWDNVYSRENYSQFKIASYPVIKQ